MLQRERLQELARSGVVLADVLGVQQPSSLVLPEPIAFDNRKFKALFSNIESNAQRFALLAFLVPESQQVPTG
jgi:hypothetical protein